MYSVISQGQRLDNKSKPCIHMPASAPTVKPFSGYVSSTKKLKKKDV